MSIVPAPNPEKPQSRSGVYSFVCITCAVGLIAALVFSAFPDIDLAVSRLFYLGDGHFLFAKPGIGATLRDLLRLAFALVCIAAVLGFCMMAFFNWRLGSISLFAPGSGLAWWRISASRTIGDAPAPFTSANLAARSGLRRLSCARINASGTARSSAGKPRTFSSSASPSHFLPVPDGGERQPRTFPNQPDPKSQTRPTS